MTSGIVVALVFILTLALAIISTAQALYPFARPSAAPPEPAALIEPVAGGATPGDQIVFTTRPAAQDRNGWQIDGIPAGAAQLSAQPDPYDRLVGAQPVCCVVSEGNRR